MYSSWISVGKSSFQIEQSNPYDVIPHIDPQITRPPSIANGVIFKEEPNIMGSRTCSSQGTN